MRQELEGSTPSAAYNSLQSRFQKEELLFQPKSKSQLYNLKHQEKKLFDSQGGSYGAVTHLNYLWRREGKNRKVLLENYPDVIVVYVHEKLLPLFIKLVCGHYTLDGETPILWQALQPLCDCRRNLQRWDWLLFL